MPDFTCGECRTCDPSDLNYHWQQEEDRLERKYRQISSFIELDPNRWDPRPLIPYIIPEAQ